MLVTATENDNDFDDAHMRCGHLGHQDWSDSDDDDYDDDFYDQDDDNYSLGDSDENDAEGDCYEMYEQMRKIVNCEKWNSKSNYS